MSNKRRVLFGAMGALAPIIVSMVTIDFEAVAQGATLSTWVGYGIRVFALSVLGGAVAYFHKNETSEFKAFQLGMAWPAFVTAGSIGIQSGVQYDQLTRAALEVDSVYVAMVRSDSVSVTSAEHLDHLFDNMIVAPDSTFWARVGRGFLASKSQTGLPPIRTIR